MGAGYNIDGLITILEQGLDSQILSNSGIGLYLYAEALIFSISVSKTLWGSRNSGKLGNWTITRSRGLSPKRKKWRI
jgi:hypothetical protein